MLDTAIAHNISNYRTVIYCIANYDATANDSSHDVSVPNIISCRTIGPAHDQAN